MKELVHAGKKEVHYDTLVLKDYLLRIDNDGFIIPSKKYSDPDISMVFLGGSTTECRFVEEENRFPYLTGTLLERKLGIKINSYNAARSGNNSLHSLDILINKVLPLKPDIVIMMENINDISILLHEKSYWNKNRSRSVIFNVNDEIVSNFIKIMRDRWIPYVSAEMRNIDRSIRSFRKSDAKANDEFAATRGKPIPIDKHLLVEQFEMNLQSLIYLCKARNIIPVIMTMSSRFKEKPDKIVADAVKDTGVDYGQFKDLFDTFNESIRKKAKENNIMVIDLARKIPQEKEFMYDIVHHNDNGSIKSAEIISEQLAPLVQQIQSIPKH
ncbi:MAG: SGNH/GDSL hydrolase family protein [Deltaproteobacteria bacterium]|nr:SGNH/GDSL hydrolase family protein [Deltaproteobacteria bacterium]